MRRMFFALTGASLLAVVGCHHMAGVCDCDMSPWCGIDSYRHTQCNQAAPDMVADPVVVNTAPVTPVAGNAPNKINIETSKIDMPKAQDNK